MKKKIIAMLLTATMIAGLFAGCGKEEETVQTDTKTFVYVGTYENLVKTDENQYVSNVTIGKEDIYYLVTNYDEETYESTTTIHAVPIKGGDARELSISLEDKGYVTRMAVANNGNVMLIENVYDEETWNEEYILQVFDSTGNELFTKSINDAMGEDSEYFYIDVAAFDLNGNVYLSDGDSSIYCFDGTNGDVLFDITNNYCRGIVGCEEGAYICGYDEDWNMCLSKIDFAKQSVTDTYKDVPSGVQTINRGLDQKIYMSTGSNLYSYDEKTGQSELIMNWLDSDIDCDNISDFRVMENGSIVLVETDYSNADNAVQKAVLEKQEVSPENQKIELTLLVGYVDYSLKKQILNFNKTNASYRIRVKDYSDVDYDKMQTQMLADLSGSNAPDIVDLSMLDMNMLAKKGYLMDLYPYFNKDFNMDDFQKNVIETGMVDGKLYGLVSGFSVYTSAAKASNVAGITEWNIDTFSNYIKNRPAGTEVFSYTTKENMLQMLLAFDVDEFVDWNTGTCSFDSDYFKKLLELCNEFPLEYEWSEDDESLPNKVQNDQTILFDLSLTQMEELQVYHKMAGEELAFVGYPVKGTCSPIAICSGIKLGIHSKCKNADGAWEFVKQILSDDFQKQMYELPVKKSVQEDMFKEAMTPEYEKDENGNEVEVPKMSYGWDNWNAEIYAMTEEEAAQMRTLIDSVTGSFNNNDILFQMINEEAQAYFQGQKSVDEVANIIQSRISLYVNENM